MIHLVNEGNNGPWCIEYRVYLITSISLFAITRLKLERCTTCENWSIISLVDFKTCPSVDNLDKLLGRLLMRLTSSSTLFMNSSIVLSPDPGMREIAIFILAAREPVRSNPVSNKLSSAWMHVLANIGITCHFRSSLQLFLHAFLREPWKNCRAGIRGGVQFSQLMRAQTCWFQEVNIAQGVTSNHNTTHIWLFFHSNLTTDERALDFFDSATLTSAT